MIPTRDLFNRHHVRCTTQRLALYEALRHCTSHPSADELFRMVAPNVGGMSRATVYNTLEILCKAGLARRMPTADGCCRFDADISDHLHVRVRDTAEIRDVPEHLGQQLLQSLPAPVIAEIERHLNVRIEAVTIQMTATSRDGCGLD